MSFFGCRPIQESPQKLPLPEEKVDSTLIELPLNAESFTQPEDSSLLNAESLGQPEDNSLLNAESCCQPEDSNLLDLVDQTQEETAGASSVDLEWGGEVTIDSNNISDTPANKKSYSYCGKTYAHYSSYRRHSIVVHSDKGRQCNHCFRTFYSKSDWSDHIMTHITFSNRCQFNQ